jgi:hypothetical protein
VFDGDRLLTHNAFRAPGSITLDELDGRPYKASFFCSRYDATRIGIRAFDCYVTDDNLQLLDGCTFVFVCIDSGAARRVIVEHLLARAIPFVDCGLGMLVNHDQHAIFGTVRTTLVTPERADAAMGYLSFGDDEPGDDVYASNIQVAELNAMNACMAVMRFKQHLRFYVDLRGETQWTFGTSTRASSTVHRRFSTRASCTSRSGTRPSCICVPAAAATRSSRRWHRTAGGWCSTERPSASSRR